MAQKFIVKTILTILLSGCLFCFTLDAQINFEFQSQYKYLKGNQAAGISSEWKDIVFDDTGWSTGYAPFWYGDGTGGTELTDMQGSYSTLYLRTSFNAADANNINTLTLNVDFDDGFVIWINGTEVLRQYAPEVLSHDALAADLHESGIPEEFVLDANDFSLIEGQNTMAVQGFNISLSESSDFHFEISIYAEPDIPELIDTIGLSFSHDAGFYDNPFDLGISSPDPEADIIYTLDGSNPQSSESKFAGDSVVTITVDPASTTGRAATPGFIVRASLDKDGFRPSKPESRTYIFIENLKTQSYPGGTWPTEDINGQIIDLDMDSDVINDSRYSSLIDDALLEIPTISVATDIKYLFDPDTGIYVNAWGHGPEWERECSAELINSDGSEGFNVNAGLRIRGGWSRHNYFPKHAFRLFFRSKYGDPKLYFPLFGDEGVEEFDKIDLRCAMNYAWSTGDSRNTMVREVFSRDSQRDTKQPYTRSRHYHLYLNGMYWGLFQTQERSEARYAADYFGDNREDYDVVKVNTEDWNYQIEATDGNLDAWQLLWNKCNTGFQDNESYFDIIGKDANGRPKKGSQVLVDIDNLIDYMIGIFYTGNFDAPTSSFMRNDGPNNFYAIFNRNDKSKGFTFYNHDAEHALFYYNAWPGIGIDENRINIGTISGELKMEVDNFGSFHPQWLHFRLSQNEEYRIRFADRAYTHLTGNGVYTPDKCLERFDRRVSEIDTAVIAESARWGDANSGTAYTKDDNWWPEIQTVRTLFFPNRTNIVINQLKDANLYPSINPPDVRTVEGILEESVYSLSSSMNISIENPNSTGTIYYTLNDEDPRLVGGDISPSASEMNDGEEMEVSNSTIIKARIYNNGNWSALKNITFIGQQDDYSNLKVTELHYHPADHIEGTDTIPGKDLEFIEFKNIGETGINLTGLVLDSAVYYEFPDNVVLGPKNFFVVASKPTKFYNYYGMLASGNFQGNFSNGGEEVLLTNGEGEEIIHFYYYDDSPWPVLADGIGFSMVSTEFNPQGDPNDASYWRSSLLVDGSAFKDDDGLTDIFVTEIITDSEIKVYPNPTSDHVVISLDSPEEYQQLDIRLYNTNGMLVYQSVEENNAIVNLNNLGLSHGIYFIRIETDNVIETAKIIFSGH
ncbi:MAG: CotH kinase family protein [Bacteroidales bacterium]|nr:MAG: CotH kinase family protein [Bacteroidales bacterium]